MLQVRIWSLTSSECTVTLKGHKVRGGTESGTTKNYKCSAIVDVVMFRKSWGFIQSHSPPFFSPAVRSDGAPIQRVRVAACVGVSRHRPHHVGRRGRGGTVPPAGPQGPGHGPGERDRTAAPLTGTPPYCCTNPCAELNLPRPSRHTITRTGLCAHRHPDFHPSHALLHPDSTLPVPSYRCL